MANELNDVVRVVIFDQSTAITTASFQIPLILASFTSFPERTRSYNNIQAVGEDFPVTSVVHKIAEKLFGQAGVLGAPPPSIVVGRRQVGSVTLTPVVADNVNYVVEINGVEYSYNSGEEATAETIVQGLVNVIDTIEDVEVIAEGGSLTASSLVDWVMDYSSNFTLLDQTSSETIVDALVAVEQENSEWYAVVADTRIASEQEALSDAIQAREKIYGLSTSDPTAITTEQTDIGAKLSAKSAARTFGVYLPTADEEYPEAAWIGSQLAVTPGQNDWDFKRANGVTVSKLSATSIANLKAKNYNYFHSKGGVNIFQNGDMFSGQFIDQMRVA